MGASLPSSRPDPRNGYLSVPNAALYYRAIGQGQALIVLHGGPDFDHTYLLPDLDRLSDSFRLIYYDQRGRGKSAANVRPDDVSIASEIADLDALREHFHLASAAVLGHSFGGLLAMEYATRHPERVSHLILLNTAPASFDDWVLFRQDRRARAPDDLHELSVIASSAGYREGDPDTVAAYYRVHFRSALWQPELLDQLVRRLRASFTNEGVLKARAIEDRLDDETRRSSAFNLLSRLARLRVPTLVIHGDDDICPVAGAAHVAQAIPGARLVVLRHCGHFSYLERPDDVRKELVAFFRVA